jgi:hypothetical protein
MGCIPGRRILKLKIEGYIFVDFFLFASSSGGGETDLNSVKPKTTRLGGRKICSVINNLFLYHI